MQVKHEDFKTCNASTPLATHTNGNDSITITRNGHYFFMCGVPGHCASGQKVDINVRRLSTVVAPSPSVLSSPGKPTADSPAPAPSGAVSSADAPRNGLLLVIAAAAATVGLFWS